MDNLFGNFDLKDKKHIMIDIETLSTRPNAVIYEIAAIEFKLNFNDDAINGDPIFAYKIIDDHFKKMSSVYNSEKAFSKALFTAKFLELLNYAVSSL